jgi:hypothetical protein
MDRVVKIVNMKQVAKYIKHGVQPVRIYTNEESDTLVFEFFVADTKELYTKWLNRELD